MVIASGSAGGAMVPKGCPNSSLLAIHNPVRAHQLDAYLFEPVYAGVYTQTTRMSVCLPVRLPTCEARVNPACL